MRIRTLKPEFWSDEKLGPLSPIDRLVFLGLISIADDAGRLVDAVRQLDGLLFPYTADTCGPSLEILARLSRIRRYTSESGQQIIQIEGWAKHQRVDKPAKYVLPAPPAGPVVPQQESPHSGDPREDVARTSRESRAPTLDLRPTTYDLRPTTAGGSHAEFSTWMGEHAECLTHIAPLTQAAIWGVWGPHGTQAHDWRGIESPRQQPILATAILTYAAEGKRGFHRPFFAKILNRAIDDATTSERQNEQRDTEREAADDLRAAAKAREEAEVARLNEEAKNVAPTRVGANPTPEQLGVKVKAVPPATSPDVLQAEAKRKLEEARRLA